MGLSWPIDTMHFQGRCEISNVFNRVWRHIFVVMAAVPMQRKAMAVLYSQVKALQ